MLAAAPAQAATPLAGVLLDQAIPVANADTYLYWYDGSGPGWTYESDTTTGADGSWTLPAPTHDARYALYYSVNNTSALFSSSQGWNGALTVDDLTTQFTATAGTATVTSFPQTLLRNAGVAQVAVKDGNSTTPLTGAVGDGYGALYLYDNYTAVDGYVDVSGYIQEDEAAFDGSLTLGHLVAGTYYRGYVEGENGAGVNYNTEQLDPVTITVGATTTIPDVKVYPEATTPSVRDVLPTDFDPVVTGTAKVDSLLTAALPATSVALSYQWRGAAPVPGATTATFLPTAKDLGQEFTVAVIARQPGFRSIRIASDETKPVAAGDGNVVTIALSGTAKFGKALKATITSALPNSTNSFQWYRNGAPISGADGSSYTLKKADVGESVFAAVKSTVQGHTDSVTPSAAKSIAKDTASVKVSTDKTITKSVKPKVKVTLKAGASKNSARGKVRVYYTSTKYKVKTLANNSSKTFTLPKLKAGTHTIKVRFLGNDNYKVKTVNVKVKVS
jgi:hypothetical protein